MCALIDIYIVFPCGGWLLLEDSETTVVLTLLQYSSALNQLMLARYQFS